MSRALTVFSRKERDSQAIDGEVEKVMESQGCSEPVARHLLKAAKLGIGPLGQQFGEQEREPEPDTRPAPQTSRLSRKAAALEFEQRLRDREEMDEREAQERRRNKSASKPAVLGAFVNPASQKDDEKKGGAKKIQFGGLSRLGPVVARQEAVDPLNRDSTPLEMEDDEDDDQGAPVASSSAQSSEAMEKKRAQLEEERRRQRQGKKKKRRRGRDDVDSENSEDSEGKPRRFTDKDAREESPPPGLMSYKQSQPSGASGSGSAGSLMSEKEVMAMMGKHKGQHKAERGSIRAKQRIQKESQEWERAKAQNPEFWKPPVFALCFSAENGKRQGPY